MSLENMHFVIWSPKINYTVLGYFSLNSTYSWTYFSVLHKNCFYVRTDAYLLCCLLVYLLTHLLSYFYSVFFEGCCRLDQDVLWPVLASVKFYIVSLPAIFFSLFQSRYNKRFYDKTINHWPTCVVKIHFVSIYFILLYIYMFLTIWEKSIQDKEGTTQPSL